MCRHPFTPSPSRVIFQMGPAWTYGCKTYGPIRLLLLLNLFLFLGVQQLSSGTEGRRIEKSRFSKRCPCSKNMRKKNTHMQKHMVIYTISYDITAHIRYIPSTRPNKNPTKPDLLCADFEVFIPGGAKRQGAIMEQHLGWSQSRSRGHGPKSSIKRTCTARSHHMICMIHSIYLF